MLTGILEMRLGLGETIVGTELGGWLYGE